MRQDEVDQRPALERAAEAVNDAEEAVSGVRHTIVNLLGRGDISKDAAKSLSEAISKTSEPFVRARSAIAEVAS